MNATSTDPVNKRRKWLITAAAASVGGAAGLLGWNLGFAQNRSPSTREPAPGFWSQQWPGPDGQPVRTQSFQGHPLLLNFWATWCPPCVDELPLINAFYNQNKANGMQVLGIAVDKVPAVQAFLGQNTLNFPIAIAGFGVGELSRALGNMSGGLPFSVMVGADGAVVQRKMGRVTTEDLANWARIK